MILNLYFLGDGCLGLIDYQSIKSDEKYFLETFLKSSFSFCYSQIAITLFNWKEIIVLWFSSLEFAETTLKIL